MIYEEFLAELVESSAESLDEKIAAYSAAIRLDPQNVGPYLYKCCCQF
jgi:hypothetical protein